MGASLAAVEDTARRPWRADTGSIDSAHLGGTGADGAPSRRPARRPPVTAAANGRRRCPAARSARGYPGVTPCRRPTAARTETRWRMAESWRGARLRSRGLFYRAWSFGVTLWRVRIGHSGRAGMCSAVRDGRATVLRPTPARRPHRRRHALVAHAGSSSTHDGIVRRSPAVGRARCATVPGPSSQHARLASAPLQRASFARYTDSVQSPTTDQWRRRRSSHEPLRVALASKPSDPATPVPIRRQSDHCPKRAGDPPRSP